MKTASILTLVLAAGAAVAQNNPVTAYGNTGAMGTGDDAFGGPRAGNIIYSSLDMVDNQTYNAGNGDANSGLGAFGVLYDLQVADDFTTTNDNVITNVTADYLTFFGANPADGLRVSIFDDVGGAPSNTASFSTVAPVTGFSTFSDTVFGLVGTRISADVNIPLAANTSYYIMIQPVDTTSSGDWYFIARQTGRQSGGDAYMRDGTNGNGGYGFSNWTSANNAGFGAGDASMQIMAVPAPGAMALLGLGGLVATRRRR